MPSALTSVVWGNVSAPVTFNFKAPGDCEMYNYGTAYGLDGCEHTGIDIGLACGTTIYAVADGVITCSGSGSAPGYDGGWCYGFGDVNCGGGAGRIEQVLDDGSVVIYGHCATALVSVQTRVRRGDPIATSGGMNGPHLHFELRKPGCSTCSSGYSIEDPEELLTGAVPNPPNFSVGDVLRVASSSGLNLREGPGLSYSIVQTMPVNLTGC